MTVISQHESLITLRRSQRFTLDCILFLALCTVEINFQSDLFIGIQKIVDFWKYTLKEGVQKASARWYITLFLGKLKLNNMNYVLVQTRSFQTLPKIHGLVGAGHEYTVVSLNRSKEID